VSGQVFVGNLSTTITKPKLVKVFKEFGEVESVRLRSMALEGTKIADHGNQKLVKKVSANKRLLSDVKDTYNAYVVFKVSHPYDSRPPRPPRTVNPFPPLQCRRHHPWRGR
jgi:hypothetical protein